MNIGGGLSAGVMLFRSAMAIKRVNTNAASVEAGGVRRWTRRVSERRGVSAGQCAGLDHVVRRALVVVAMDLIAVARLEQIEEVLDEVVDLNDGVVTDLNP